MLKDKFYLARISLVQESEIGECRAKPEEDMRVGGETGKRGRKQP